MALARFLPAVMVMGLTLAACQSPADKAVDDELKVAAGVEAVCAARSDVDAAMATVAALTPESTVGDAEQAGEKLRAALAKLDGAEGELSKAEVKEYRDQVALFQEEVEKVRKDKSLTLKEASEQLQGKVAPVAVARAQLASATVCVEVDEEPTANQKADADGPDGTNDTDKADN